MKIPPVKGTRDFYPEQMALRNWIIDGWKKTSMRNGFVEYDGPILEHLQMYQIKSGDEIVEQLFNMTDRGGRDLAIRPEITPTLARMVNQQINSLPRPIKWFSVPRLCRAERPQKGRLREFFQWNIDIIGIDDVLADAEVIFTTVDYLRQVGLKAEDIVVKISSRKMLAAMLASIGIEPGQMDSLYRLLDKKSKLPQEAFEQMLGELITDPLKLIKIFQLMDAKTIEQINDLAKSNDAEKESADELKRLFALLGSMGIGEFCQFDINIVRGLAYYTGIVFEVYDRKAELRAIGGGGRYDDLLKQFGGPAISATGMGMGDCVLEILLEERGILKNAIVAAKLDYFVAYVDEKLLTKAVEITAKLRTAGKSVNFSYKGGNLGKQLKEASSQNAAKCIIVGDEINDGSLAVKDMTSGQQELVNIEKFFKAV